MNALSPATRAIDGVRRWLTAALDAEDARNVVPEGDPLCLWWTPVAGDPKISLLLDVILGAEDHLTLLALIQYARTKAGGPSLPFAEDVALTGYLVELAAARRNATPAVGFDAFVSYAHHDAGRARLIVSMLRAAGLTVFHDVEQIRPGDNIVGRLHAAVSNAGSAVILVSAAYVASAWAGRELGVLLGHHRVQGMRLLPVLLDDVPLPDDIADICTVDLRGLPTRGSRAWARPRLAPLIEACRGDR